MSGFKPRKAGPQYRIRLRRNRCAPDPLGP